MISYIKQALKDLKSYWALIIYCTLVFEGVGITMYLKHNDTINLWIWALVVFVGITIESLIITRLNRNKLNK